MDKPGKNKTGHRTSTHSTRAQNINSDYASATPAPVRLFPLPSLWVHTKVHLSSNQRRGVCLLGAAFDQWIKEDASASRSGASLVRRAPRTRPTTLTPQLEMCPLNNYGQRRRLTSSFAIFTPVFHACLLLSSSSLKWRPSLLAC